MTAFVALLRGVNVGKAKRVPMADWRVQLHDLGYTEVATLLNSGNAVFCANQAPSAQHATAIAAAIERGLDVRVAVVVKSAKEFSAIVAENPFATRAEDHSRLMVAFAPDNKLLAALESLAGLAVAPEEFAVGKHAAYLYCPAGILESKLATAMLGKVGAAVTTRNWATTLKLQALLAKNGDKKTAVG